jgi:hypothetical protein
MVVIHNSIPPFLFQSGVDNQHKPNHITVIHQMAMVKRAMILVRWHRCQLMAAYFAWKYFLSEHDALYFNDSCINAKKCGIGDI